MIQVHRILRRAHAVEPFGGEGARLWGGRWNPPGVRVAYASSSLALAALEYFANLRPERRPDDLASVAAELPESIEIESIDPEALPPDWRESPAPDSLRALGIRWVEAGRSAVLRVPSAIIPREFNYLINPDHPRFREILVGPPEPFEFDRRL